MSGDTELDDLLAAALEAAETAGDLLRAGRGTGYEVATKSTATDMVTGMDRAAEAAVVAVLAARRPDDAVVGEEGTARPGTSGVRWLVDPLDGTTNYLYDLPAWSVSVAAEKDGETLVGVVRDPSHGETFSAVRGRGSWLSIDGVAERRRLGRGEGDGRLALDLSSALVGTGFAYAAARRGRQARVLTSVLPAVRDIRRLGSAALDLCAVAAGRLDAYYERGTAPWDHAAGALVAAEAGCWVGGLEHDPLPDQALLAAADPRIASAFRQLLARSEGGPDLGPGPTGRGSAA